jgi:ATP-binding cassette subfamily F protein uup
VFEGDGQVGEFDGGYDDWLRIHEQRLAAAASQASGKSDESLTRSSSSAAAAAPAAAPAAPRGRKLSFREQRELESLPDRIAELEARQAELQQQLASPGFFQSGGAKITEVTTELSRVADELAQCFARWEQLESTA